MQTFIALNLNAFGDGGCSILYFVIEYRRDSGRGPNSKYTMVANNVRPRERAYTIRGLDPASRYYIKVHCNMKTEQSCSTFRFSFEYFLYSATNFFLCLQKLGDSP